MCPSWLCLFQLHKGFPLLANFLHGEGEWSLLRRAEHTILFGVKLVFEFGGVVTMH